MQPLTVLTIAGSDSGGGAGIQADLRTFCAFEVHATTALTAVTAQNTIGVDVGARTSTPTIVAAQVQSVVDDFEVSAVKTGMLAQPATVETRRANSRARVSSPTSWSIPCSSPRPATRSWTTAASRPTATTLLAYAEIVTPNLREAAMLCDVDVRRREGPRRHGRPRAPDSSPSARPGCS